MTDSLRAMIPNHAKITIVEATNERQSFQEMNALMHKVSKETKKNLFHTLINCDIFLDQEIDWYDQNCGPEVVFALTRYNYDMNTGKTDFQVPTECSQDAWIFYNTVPLIQDIDFHFGIPGCDNRLAAEIAKSGLQLCNACFTLKVYHVHRDGQRSYPKVKDVVPKPYLHIQPCTVSEFRLRGYKKITTTNYDTLKLKE